MTVPSQQITIAAPQTPQPQPQAEPVAEREPVARSHASAPHDSPQLPELVEELAVTVADLASVLTQQTAIIRLQGERLDQLASLLKERDEHAKATMAAMIQVSDRMEAMIGEQDRAREELGVATAALTQVALDLRTMYELELAEDEEDEEAQ